MAMAPPPENPLRRRRRGGYAWNGHRHDIAMTSQRPHPEKAALRSKALAARRAMTPQARREASRRIVAHVLEHPDFLRAGGVHCFISLPEEVDTQGIFEACWRLGKRTYVPYQLPGEGRLGCARREPGDPLTPGPMNVPEPAAERRAPAAPEEIDLVLAPGVAFDREGNRMGYGKGYYDSFLSQIATNSVQNANMNTGRARQGVAIIGLGFWVQIVPTVPRDSWDIQMDVTLTERGPLERG